MLPYAWPHTFIPLIPYYLLSVLVDSPSPFLFGTTTTTFSSVRDSIPSDVVVVFLSSSPPSPSFSIPEYPKRWILHQLSLIDLTQSDSALFSQVQHVVGTFFWMLLPRFSSYLYTLLGNTCYFNHPEYIVQEVPDTFKPFYQRLLTTQSFAMFVDHFWLPHNASLLALQHPQILSEEANEKHYRIRYPLFSFSQPHATHSDQLASSLFHLRSIALPSPHTLLNPNDYVFFLVHPTGSSASSSSESSSASPASSALLSSSSPPNPSRAFSQPYASPINRLLKQYLLDPSSKKSRSVPPFTRRSTDLANHVKEGLVEKSVRTNFIEILTQPTTPFCSYHIISSPSAENLAFLFNSFYTSCVKQRDYVNGLQLHKITAVFIVNDPLRQFPLYGYLYTHEIYKKVGFWRELLVDYCRGNDVSAAYRMHYRCLSDEEHAKRRKNVLNASEWIARNLTSSCESGEWCGAR